MLHPVQYLHRSRSALRVADGSRGSSSWQEALVEIQQLSGTTLSDKFGSVRSSAEATERIDVINFTRKSQDFDKAFIFAIDVR
mmetsp:Transcript_78573/g.173408  ORF Transcript_78573/g.173408 Transcript_78573/m.173408 type:complete len:83 (-) Transcript_78573:215-463(-)